jgi:hypothetical protein
MLIITLIRHQKQQFSALFYKLFILNAIWNAVSDVYCEH